MIAVSFWFSELEQPRDKKDKHAKLIWSKGDKGRVGRGWGMGRKAQAALIWSTDPNAGDSRTTKRPNPPPTPQLEV